MNTFRTLLLCFVLAASWTGGAWAVSPELQALYDQHKQLYDAERYCEAIPVKQKIIQHEEREFSPESKEYYSSLMYLGELHKKVGDFEKAEQLYKRAFEIKEKILGPEHPKLSVFVSILTSRYLELGQFEEVESLFHRHLALGEKALGPVALEVAQDLSFYLNPHSQRYDLFNMLEPFFLRYLAIYEKALGPDDLKVADVLADEIGPLYVEQSLFNKAEPLYQRALAIYEKTLDPYDPKIMDLRSTLARAYLYQGRFADIVMLWLWPRNQAPTL